MSTSAGPRFSGYHAHIYFDVMTRDQAVSLSEAAAEAFNVELGRVHERLIGPHPCWSRQIAFQTTDHARFVEWLEGHRDGLTVLIHGLSGDAFADHTTHAAWLGVPHTLNLSIFERDQ